MFNFRKFIPKYFHEELWGDRDKWGKIIDVRDPDWIEWQKINVKYYHENQRGSIGTVVNNAGYKLVKRLNFSDKTILEVGSGDVKHQNFWKGIPLDYILVDVADELLDYAYEKISKIGVSCKKILVKRNNNLPINDSSVDIVIAFNSLEHLHPVEDYINEYKRILKPGGILVGTIPTEGGVGWALGRLLTSKRWVKKHTKINFNKILCWEHPNFADQVVDTLENNFCRVHMSFWPFNWARFLDLNLVIKFIYKKKK